MRMKDVAAADGATVAREICAPVIDKRRIGGGVGGVVDQEPAVRVGSFEDCFAAESVSWIMCDVQDLCGSAHNPSLIL